MLINKIIYYHLNYSQVAFKRKSGRDRLIFKNIFLNDFDLNIENINKIDT